MKARFYALTAALALVLPFIACAGQKYHMTAAPSIPAATATLHTSADKNGNTVVDLKVKRLAQPSALTPPRNTYVVWIQPAGKQPINQGELRVDNNLNGEFKTTTPYKQFQLFVTAENNAKTEQPSGQPLLQQQLGG